MKPYSEDLHLRIVGAVRDVQIRRSSSVWRESLLSQVIGGRQLPKGLVSNNERGCELIYLPPYSADLNPIEEAFSKIKRILSKAEARAGRC
jgi:hypothetical protein